MTEPGKKICVGELGQLRALVHDIMERYMLLPDRYLPAGKLERLLIRHGFLSSEPREATPEDVKTEWGRRWGLDEGDLIYEPTELGEKVLK